MLNPGLHFWHQSRVLLGRTGWLGFTKSSLALKVAARIKAQWWMRHRNKGNGAAAVLLLGLARSYSALQATAHILEQSKWYRCHAATSDAGAGVFFCCWWEWEADEANIMWLADSRVGTSSSNSSSSSRSIKFCEILTKVLRFPVFERVNGIFSNNAFPGKFSPKLLISRHFSRQFREFYALHFFLFFFFLHSRRQ